MAEVGLTYSTLLDLKAQLGPDNKLTRAINMMSMKNDFIKMLPVIPANGKTYHKTSMLVGLPTPAWRKLNGGTPSSTDSHAEATETIGMLESWQRTDKALAKLSGNPGEYRMLKGESHLEALTQNFATTFWYADKSTPEKPLGMSPRYGVLSGSEIADNVHAQGGAGADNTSIWYGRLSPQNLAIITPEGSPSGGVEHESKDDHITENAGGVPGNFMSTYIDHWMWNVGIALMDWRYWVRMCNIDVSALLAGAGADLLDALIKAESVVPDDAASMPGVILMNKTVWHMFRIQVRDAVSAGGGLTYENVGGMLKPFWNGNRIIVTDSLINAEALVA